MGFAERPTTVPDTDICQQGQAWIPPYGGDRSLQASTACRQSIYLLVLGALTTHRDTVPHPRDPCFNHFQDDPALDVHTLFSTEQRGLPDFLCCDLTSAAPVMVETLSQTVSAVNVRSGYEQIRL